MAKIMFVEMSPSGGLFQYGYQLGSELAKLGHRVEIVTGPDPELASAQPNLTISSALPTWHSAGSETTATIIRRLRRPLRALRHVGAMFVLMSLISRRRPDVIFFQPLRFPMDTWLVQACRVISPHTRRCLVMHETRPLGEHRRTGSLYREGRWFDDVLSSGLHRAISHMHAIFVLGESAREDAVARYQPRVPVTVIPHGDEDVFLDPEHVVPVDLTEPTVLFFGIWTRHKGIPQLIEAFAEVLASVPSARLIIAGAVQADMELAEIEALAAPVNGVVLRPGYVAIGDVPELFGHARVVVIPYLRANQSGVVHLAQSFGRPIVATDVGDIPAAVPDGKVGLIVPPDDVPALAEALRTLLKDAELAARLGTAGRERLTDEASWEHVAEIVARVAVSPHS